MCHVNDLIISLKRLKRLKTTTKNKMYVFKMVKSQLFLKMFNEKIGCNFGQ